MLMVLAILHDMSIEVNAHELWRICCEFDDFYLDVFVVNLKYITIELHAKNIKAMAKINGAQWCYDGLKEKKIKF